MDQLPLNAENFLTFITERVFNSLDDVLQREVWVFRQIVLLCRQFEVASLKWNFEQFIRYEGLRLHQYIDLIELRCRPIHVVLDPQDHFTV